MSSNFRDVDRDTLYLLPPSLQEWLPEGHLARFVVEMVEQLDLRELEEGYRGSGHHVPLAERQPPPASDTQPADAVTAMAHRLRTPEGRALYARRKSTVETVFGIVKEVMGFRRFHLRGFQAAQGEWNLVCMAWNLKRMHALSG